MILHAMLFCSTYASTSKAEFIHQSSCFWSTMSQYLLSDIVTNVRTWPEATPALEKLSGLHFGCAYKIDCFLKRIMVESKLAISKNSPKNDQKELSEKDLEIRLMILIYSLDFIMKRQFIVWRLAEIHWREKELSKAVSSSNMKVDMKLQYRKASIILIEKQ